MGAELLLIPVAATASSSRTTIIQRAAPLLLQFRHFTFFNNNNNSVNANALYYIKQTQQQQRRRRRRVSRSFAADATSLDPPDLRRLAETARISLTPHEIEEFSPKIQQVVDWFGQLQAVDLESIEPAIRADTDGSHLRDDLPETFEKREAIIAEVPNYEEPFIKVPKVLNKE